MLPIFYFYAQFLAKDVLNHAIKPFITNLILITVPISVLLLYRIFGGLVSDMTSRYRFFLSDFTDGLHLQCFASTIFLYFACITPIVTFGGLMGQKTDNYMVSSRFLFNCSASSQRLLLLLVLLYV